MQSTIIIFLDGVGIGENDPGINPFFQTSFKFFNDIFGQTPHLKNQHLQSSNKFLFPIDACMGIEGFPQSGTGQTSIYCGFNAAKEIGKHFGPYPYSTLKPFLEKDNIFQSLKEAGLSINFANAFPKIFFDYINSGRKRLNVTSLMALYSNIKFFDVDDLLNGDSVSAEITNRRWVEKLNYDIPIISAEEAAMRLLNIGRKNNFTLFEYFHTDHIGHGRLASEKDLLLSDLDIFLHTILDNVDENITLLICSDHGNLENIKIKSHTRNPAIGITAGKYAEQLKNRIGSLYDIKQAVMELYE